MSTRDPLREQLRNDLAAYEAAHGALPGIRTAQRREAFIQQLVDSVRRIDYFRVAESRRISPDRRSPQSPLFDPLLAAILHRQAGQIDEGCWLAFLAIHCGRHRKDGWSLARQLYAGDGPDSEWTWDRVSAAPTAFRRWLHAKNARWAALNERPRFGNHRKYVSLNAHGPNGTGEVIETYVRWVGAGRTHADRLRLATSRLGATQASAFDELYGSLRDVQQFGRLAKFDFLCMLAKCGLADVAPGHAYLAGATGPLNGARQMFGLPRSSLDRAVVELGNRLGVGMQVMEDALCNWVKDPYRHVRFRG